MSSALLVGLLLMALSFAHGVIQWPTADALGTTYTVSGLSFQPKALRFYWMGLPSAVDAASETLSIERGVAFAASPTDRRYVASHNTDAAITCYTNADSDAIAVGSCYLGGRSGLLDLDAILSDGFRLIVDQTYTAGPTKTLFWEAWGGDDITVVTTLIFGEPAATGDVDYTVPGFVAAATDQVVMFAAVQGATAAAQDSLLCVGFATSGADADNVVAVGNADHNSATSDTDGYCKTGECLAKIVIGGGNATARAKLTQFGTDNFRLNWIARATTGRPAIALAIKGGQWKAGAYTIAGNSASATATVSGLAFQPLGVSLIGRMTAEQAAGTSSAQDRLALGSGSSTTSRRSMGCLSENGTANAQIDLVVEYDQVLAFPSTAGALQAAYDIDAINADGFRIIVDTAGGVASEWQGYLAFGSAVSATPNPPAPTVVLAAVQRAASW